MLGNQIGDLSWEGCLQMFSSLAFSVPGPKAEALTLGVLLSSVPPPPPRKWVQDCQKAGLKMGVQVDALEK